MVSDEIIQEVIDLLDVSIFGECRTEEGAARALSRVEDIVSTLTEWQACVLVTELWSSGYRSVATRAILTWDRLTEFPVDLKHSILGTLSTLWEDEEREDVTRLLSALGRFIDESEEDVIVRLPPFAITLMELSDDRGREPIFALAAEVGRFLMENRIDRALDARDRLYSAIVERSRDRRAATSLQVYLPEKHRSLLDEERLRLVEECVSLLRGEGTESLMNEGLDDGGFVNLDVRVRCIPCFGGWLKEQGYLLRDSGHSTWVDGSEEFEGVIEKITGSIVGRYRFHCLEAHWFVRHFERYHSEHWSDFFVPDDQREADEKPMDFCVAVEPAQIECHPELIGRLRQYEGRYHGRIPQVAVQAYRKYCQSRPHSF